MVTVIIPTFNRAHILASSVNSVLDQTYSDLEVIVVDDGSTDNTKEILSTIKDNRLRYVYQKNAGACAARNKGIELAQGEYIALHDSDDIWHKDKLQKQMEIFKKFNDVDLVFCKLKVLHIDGRIEIEPNYIEEGILRPVENLFRIGTQTIVAKKEVLSQFKFDDKLPRFQEFELLYRISKVYTMYCLDEALVDYGIGNDSISSNPMKLYFACKYILKKHPEMKHNYPAIMEDMAKNLYLGARLLRKEDNSEYKELLHMSKECYNDWKLTIKRLSVLLNLQRHFGILNK